MKRLIDKNTPLESLRTISIFEGLEEETLRVLSESFIPTKVDQGEVILRVNQSVVFFWVILEGTAVIVVQGEVVAERSVGDFLGEMGALLDQKASATVLAGTSICALKISASRFKELVPQSTLLKLLKSTGERRLELGLRLAESLKHTSQGIVKLDEAGKITSDISSQCLHYLGAKNVYDLRFKSFVEVVERLNPGFVAGWDSFELLFQPGFDEEQRQMVMALLPDRMTLPGWLRPRVLKLSYYSCLDANGQLIGLDIGMTDITSEEVLAKYEQQQRIQAKLLAQPESYLSLLSLAQQLQQDLKAPWPPTLRADLHTLKGTAGLSGLDQMQTLCHSLEDQISFGMIEEDTRADFAGQVTYITSLFDQLSPSLKERLVGFVLSPSQFDQLFQILRSQDRSDGLAVLEQISSLPLEEMAINFSIEISRVSNILGKEIEFNYQCDGVRVSQKVYKKLMPLIHLIRNAVSHGIESTEERRALGKSPVGKITFRAYKQAGWAVLQFIDDGRGLDAKKIGARARKLGLVQGRRVLKLTELKELIFHPGLSTQIKPDTLSGQGIGMAAVRDSLESIGGSIVVSSDPNQGCCFEVRLPTAYSGPQKPTL